MDITRKLATIERISAINPIPDAEKIERATVRGWNVVVEKGLYKPNDLIIYCEIDSLMPEKEEFEFLRPRGFRIRTIKLRGQVSQGIIFPLEILKNAGTNFEPIYAEEGLDVTEALEIIKYEPPIPAELSGQVKGGFPSHSIKTDEERIQNLIDHYEDYKKEEWIATEKVDGTSMTAFIYNGMFGISSRNLELKENETNSFWKLLLFRGNFLVKVFRKTNIVSRDRKFFGLELSILLNTNSFHFLLLGVCVKKWGLIWFPELIMILNFPKNMKILFFMLMVNQNFVRQQEKELFL
jgi:RNA ligase (TIGR02306 family)